MVNNTTLQLALALDGVRAYSRVIVNGDSRFSINEQQLVFFSKELANLNLGTNLLVFNKLPTIRQKIYFILYFGVANFSYSNPFSGKDYTYITKNGETIVRTNGFVTALLNFAIAWDNPKSILSISQAEWRTGLQLNTNDLYLGAERIKSIQKLAHYIEEGQIEGLDDNKIDADALFLSLMKTNLFIDPFLKRIQIVLYFLQMLSDEMSISISPRPKFSAMADYRLPQVLINTGILLVDADMKEKLIQGKVLKKNSLDEVLLRAYTIFICEQLATLKGVSEAEVDSLLWAYSQNLLGAEGDIIPAPRVATNCY